MAARSVIRALGLSLDSTPMYATGKVHACHAWEKQYEVQPGIDPKTEDRISSEGNELAYSAVDKSNVASPEWTSSSGIPACQRAATRVTIAR